MSFAFVFPGQGSQSVGMLADFGTEEPVAGAFREASLALGYDLWALVQGGPAEKLNSTEYTQPAMLVAGVALWRLWKARGGADPGEVTGHSLGEFTALVCAQTLSLGEAADLVRFRGRAMQEAVPAGTGAMAAILGLADDEVVASCDQAGQGEVVEAVNFNGPGQVVIAGDRAAVERAIEACKAAGAKRAVPLALSVPSHCSLMGPAAERLEMRLQDVKLQKPVIRYVSAVDAAPHTDPDDIRELLVRQLANPVRWQDTVAALAANGHAQIIECGPGKVLTGLNRRIAKRPELALLALEDAASLEAALAATRA
ncbi:MAG TPA: ACP S-malonyltransferase [Steroidobacteraceae bacterium]|nr:ACP S-malonyltransferase [Steroidobacteraceae bacterium]